VWHETERALGEHRPDVFFEVLRSCGALRGVFPEIDALFGVPQPPQWHPEIDTGVHTLLVVRMAARLSPGTPVRFAALVHDLGKAATPRAQWPSHKGHEEHGVRLVEQMAARLKVPAEHRDLAVLAARHHGQVHRAHELRASTILRVLEQTDAFRRPERFEDLLLACEADARGRTGLENRPYPQRAALSAARAAAAAVTLTESEREGLTGAQIGERVRTARLAAIERLRAEGGRT
jgi:tRNA nucleotidyltransferase (CCA-adding enzyme)